VPAAGLAAGEAAGDALVEGLAATAGLASQWWRRRRRDFSEE
jgi:hypothetical protein